MKAVIENNIIDINKNGQITIREGSNELPITYLLLMKITKMLTFSLTDVTLNLDSDDGSLIVISNGGRVTIKNTQYNVTLSADTLETIEGIARTYMRY